MIHFGIENTATLWVAANSLSFQNSIALFFINQTTVGQIYAFCRIDQKRLEVHNGQVSYSYEN